MTIKYGGRTRSAKETASWIVNSWIESGWRSDTLIHRANKRLCMEGQFSERMTTKEMAKVEKHIEKIRLRIIEKFTDDYATLESIVND